MASMHLPSSFHGSSLISRNPQDYQLTPLCFHITCSSLQSHWTRSTFSPGAPINARHITSLLTASLHMQTPQGAALMALTNECMPPAGIFQVASQQLDLLAEAAAECTRSRNQEGLLQRQLEEIKECEISKALQDITLALVTHRLLHAVSHQTTRQHSDDVAVDERLQAIHPQSVQPLVDRHVALVINGKDGAQLPFEPHMRARVCTLQMGQMYAASIMYGYFLARVYQRFKLERVLQLETVSMDTRNEIGVNGPKQREVISMEDYVQTEAFTNTNTFRRLNSERWSHTLNVIERHCQALFGVHQNALHASSILSIQLASVKILILQALAFGAILWEVESNFISSLYPLL